METIGKHIDEVMEMILTYQDPGTQRRPFRAVGFAKKNGTGKLSRENVSLDDPRTLGKDEYRVFRSNGHGEEMIADLATNHKNKHETFIFRRFNFGDEKREGVYTVLLKIVYAG